ncbi:MAG: Trp biosynthesis-associated membrane protein [Actinomycetota bacterium]|nr:Trp biosynthesis-associated membrane protein [Euzebyaceae bacterium]MDQ3453565.1 Trp biosynthesis-associated membrane protein [Actinomycetota bacterium]
MSGRRGWLLPIMTVLAGGLALLVATAADWTAGVVTREVGEVAVTEAAGASGTRLAPAVVPLGLLALAVGVALAALRGLARRGGALLAIGTGVAAIVSVAAGAAGETGLTAAPFAAGLGGVLVAAGGWLGLHGPVRPPPRTRYTIDQAERPADDEWSMASVEEPPAGTEGAAPTRAADAGPGPPAAGSDYDGAPPTRGDA